MDKLHIVIADIATLVYIVYTIAVIPILLTLVWQYLHNLPERIIDALQIVSSGSVVITTPTITVDMERRVERLEAGILILHKSVQALEAGQELEGYKLDQILTALQHYTPTKQHYIEPVQSVQLIEQPRYSAQLTRAMNWIREFDSNHTRPIREIADRAGVSIGTAHTARQTLKAQ